MLECPTRTDLPAYKYRIKLDGVTYQLAYSFNPRMGKWFITLGDQLGNTIVGPVPVVATWPLFDRFKEESIPPGTLMCFDSSGQNQDPGQFDLGDRCRIVYLEAGT